MKILIVDDEEIIRQGLSRFLNKEKIETLLAEDSFQALQFLAMFNVKLIICDHGIPALNGLELLKRIRSNPEYQNLPFIMITGSIDEKLIKEIISAGANKCFIKPFEPNELIDFIKNTTDGEKIE